MKRKLKKKAAAVATEELSSQDKIQKSQVLFEKAEHLYNESHYKEALNLYLDVVLLIPQHFYAFHKIGHCFEALQMKEHAYKGFEKSLNLSKNFFPAALKLIEVLWNLGHKENALRIGVEAMMRFPSIGDFGVLFAKLLGESTGYTGIFMMKKEILRLIRKNPKLLAYLIMLRLHPKVAPETREDEMREQKRIEAYISRLQKMKPKFDELPNMLHTFFPATYNAIGTKAHFENVSNCLREIFPSLNKENHFYKKGSTPSSKIRVGIYSPHFNKKHAVHACFGALFAKMNKKNFELIHIDSMYGQYMKPLEDGKVLMDEYYFVKSSTEAENVISSLNLDVIFYLDPCLHSWGYYLLHMRLVPIQCAMLGHPTTFGTKTLDYYISSEDLEAENGAQNYTETLVKLKGAVCVYEKVQVGQSYTPLFFNLPQRKNIYLCAQGAAKLQYGMDSIFRGILEKDPNGILIFIKTDGFIHIEERWKKYGTFDAFEGRVIILNPLPFESFLGLLSIAHASLDTFPFGAGNTAYQAVALGTPIVAYNCQEAKGRATHYIYKKLGLEHLICHTKEAYIDLAVRFGTDPHFRKEVSETILKGHDRIFEDYTIVGELETFLQKVVHEKRLELCKENAA